jgi:hypothetical protein
MTPSRRACHHFTPLAVGPWTPQTALDTARVESNLYWLKTFSRAAYEADRQRALETPGRAVGEAGERIADALAGRDYLLACMRELLFESVREQIDPRLPSRRRCLFLVDGEADLAGAARRFGFDGQGRAVLSIEPVGDCRIFRAHSALLETSPIVADIMNAAHAYWSGAGLDTPREEVEVLLEGSFSVRAVARFGNAGPVHVTGRSFVDVFRSAG